MQHLDTDHERRLQQLESQLGRLLRDRRVGATLTGPFPVTESFMGYRRITGRYYCPGTVAAIQDATRDMAVVANRLYALPFLVAEKMSLNRLATYTKSGATGNVRMGVYRSNNALSPTQLVKGSGSVGVGASSNVHNFSPPISLSRGLYWIAAVFSGTPTMYRLPYEQGVTWEILGRTLGISNSMRPGWRSAHSFAALPVVFPLGTLTAVQDLPIMWVRPV